MRSLPSHKTTNPFATSSQRGRNVTFLRRSARLSGVAFIRVGGNANRRNKIPAAQSRQTDLQCTTTATPTPTSTKKERKTRKGEREKSTGQQGGVNYPVEVGSRQAIAAQRANTRRRHAATNVACDAQPRGSSDPFVDRARSSRKTKQEWGRGRTSRRPSNGKALHEKARSEECKLLTGKLGGGDGSWGKPAVLVDTQRPCETLSRRRGREHCSLPRRLLLSAAIALGLTKRRGATTTSARNPEEPRPTDTGSCLQRRDVRVSVGRPCGRLAYASIVRSRPTPDKSARGQLYTLSFFACPVLSQTLLRLSKRTPTVKQ